MTAINSWGLLGAVLLLSGPGLFADVNMTLTGPGNNGSISNIYVGPYEGTINGVSTPIICDDFFDETYFNEAWTASVSTVSSLSSIAKFGAANVTLYDQAAWLATQLVNPATTCPNGPANCAGDIQYAIWQVFDNSGSDQPFSLLSGNDKLNAQYWLNQAQTQTFTTNEFSNVTVYTAVSCSANCGGPGKLPQEFLTVSTPEPSELALMGVDFSGVGALLFLIYRRRARQA